MTAIRILAPQWGNNDVPAAEFIDRVIAAGFDGIEMSLPDDGAEREDWLRGIADAGLDLVVSQWQTVFHSEFHAHRAALQSLLAQACAARPLLVNSHTGKDFYSPEQNEELIALADAIAREYGVPIVHEIHRSRFSGHPMLLRPYLQRLPHLRLTADLSHWCAACESLLEDQPATLEAVLPRVRHIHARVGHAQGPQVPDFRAPEYAVELAAHLAWWDRIVALRRADGDAVLTITPEFGPAPYTFRLPYTQALVADAWELNVAMAGLLRERYS
ncbi:sugar phosphate isomerase/epimerase [Pseudoduganella sp. SL102]|uniref:sugar phosphate isomerase/epimerase family protein n=1 Tax=Pseudoduganella sp. SL102 TaxID=2995154 RepID=UPI00248B925B|nr:TIM barrel protein [Pseudoduganella sp. SL102]WBS01967.1 sugar phosphate isomerase/epimerase [Pseudoduganella sp. SL102]